MKVLAKNGKPLYVKTGGVILPPATTSEPEPCTVTVTSSDYGPNVWLYVFYISQDGKLTTDTTQKTLPLRINTIQNSIMVLAPSGLAGMPSIRNATNIDYTKLGVNMYVVPKAAKCSLEIYDSD